MKKVLTALALSSAVAATTYAQRGQTDREFEGLKGPVRSVSVERATLTKQGEREVEGRRVLGERVRYNARGNRVVEESYVDSGELGRRLVYRYAGGKKIGTGKSVIPTLTMAGSDPAPPQYEPISETYKYQYDAKGNIREWTFQKGTSSSVWAYRVVYELKGGRRVTHQYNPDGAPVSRDVESFDERGNLVEFTTFTPDPGTVFYKSSYTAYEFDARGNWVKRLASVLWRGQPEVRRVEYRAITYF